jgi:RsiW-degrading membrane proteinase PrsW (M82 family)
MADPNAYPSILITPGKSHNTFQLDNSFDMPNQQVQIILASSTSNKFELMLITRNNSTYSSSYYKVNNGAATNLSYIIPDQIDSFVIDVCNNLVTVKVNGQILLNVTAAGANLYSAFNVFEGSGQLMANLVTADNGTCVISTPTTSTSTTSTSTTSTQKKSKIWLIVLAIAIPSIGIGAFYVMKQYKNRQIKQ